MGWQIHWTAHALDRVRQRGLTVEEVEEVLEEKHVLREVNRGQADWRLHGTRWDGRRFAVVYDHPVVGDPAVLRVVSVWILRDRVQR